jgi:uncharacterized protein (TIGR02466 family)
MGESIHLWSPYIWKFEYEFNISELYPIIKQRFEHWSISKQSSILEDGDALSTATLGVYDSELQPHNLECLQDYHIWLTKKIEYVWNKFKYNSPKSHISKSWFNIHNEGGKTLEHCHNRTDLVISAYIQAKPGCGNIEFRDPLEYHKIGSQYNIEKNLWKEVKIKSNDVLIFPGWLNHRTQPNLSNEERIVMTYNINACS